MTKSRFAIALLVVTATLAACSSTPPAGSPTGQPTGQPSSQPTQPQETDAGDPTPGTDLSACELVTPADIEAALEYEAGTVDDGELVQQPTSLDAAINECRYTGDWGGLIVNSTPTDGVNVYDAVASAFGDEAEPLDIGDGGLWFEDDDRGYFLKGSVMVRLQFTHLTEGGLTSFRDPTVALGEAAVAKVQ
jgi:hypothetical protein